MNKKLIIVMIGAFIMASLVAMMVQSSLAPKKQPIVKEVSGIEILVANKPLSKGDIVKTQDTEWKSFSEDVIFTGMVKRPSVEKEKDIDIFDKTLSRDIMHGEPITTQSVIMDIEGSSNKLSATIRPGMRAMAINVKANTSVGGFVAPNDNVDVILTYQLRMQGEVAQYASDTIQRHASETIIKNIRVLAVDQQSKEKNHEVKVARTVTLEVTAEQAQTLSLASQMGEVTLALRRIGDKGDDENLSATTDISGSQVINDIYKRMNKKRRLDGSVRVYSGNQVIDMPVNSGSGGR